MTRIFPLVTVFAMLATLCLSTTSAVPVEVPVTNELAQCVQGKWEDVRKILSAATPDDIANSPALFKDGLPITTAPSVEELKTGLEKFKVEDGENFDLFLAVLGCSPK
ncbi:hypothetical protein F5H01DRAFT_319591 [Linnemannia elongata]|nr:hypothetical protein F5H01DRAFT_319591 [Linnemannia elongata]